MFWTQSLLARGPAAPPPRGARAAVRMGILLLGLVLALGSMARGLPFGGVLFGLLSGGATTQVPYGSTVSMKAVFSNGTGIIKDQTGAITFASVDSDTPYTTEALTSSKTFTLTVANPAGDAVTASVAVTVTPISVGVITPASPTVTVGTTQQFNATVGGGIANTLTWFVDNLPGGNGTVGTITSGGLYTAPGTPGSHTIKATSTEDATQTRSTPVTVVAAPVATSLTASTLTPTFGATFTLTPVYSAGTGTLTHAGGSVTCPATGAASAAITADWTGDRIYMLTVTNAAGAAATRTVTVRPDVFAIDAFTANQPLVTYGGGATLSWSLSGPAPTALTLDGASVLGNLSALVTPRNRQTYTLSGTAGNTDTQTLKVGAQGLDLLAGNTSGAGNVDGRGPAARFDTPSGVAVDTAGNLYVADEASHTIRKITSAGVVTTLAGLAGTSGPTNGTGTAARFSIPRGVAVDTAGNVYVADSNNQSIRKITSAGVVTTLAGLAGTLGSTDATGTAARFKFPQGVAVDTAGNVYVADTDNHTIRKITSAGVVTTLAGLAGTSGALDATGSAARFNRPQGVAVDATGNVYVGDNANFTLRKITSAGVVTTLAGVAGNFGSADGTGTGARFAGPRGVAVDTTGNVYVADGDYVIRKITSGGVVTTWAGGYPSGSADGTGATARFSSPYGVAVDPTGNVFVADSANHVIRKITPLAEVSTLAGLAESRGTADGTGPAARFFNPQGVAVDAAGNIYVADSSNHTIRKVTPAGVVSTLAGLAGTSGSTNGAGTAARFNTPLGLALDAAGNLYVADTDNHTIRKITSAGVVTTLAGLAGHAGSTDGTGTAARFTLPSITAVDKDGNLYVVDALNWNIRKITPAGVVTTLPVAGDLSWVQGLAVDAAGNVYVADLNAILKITPLGVVSTLAGQAGNWGSADGTGAAAQFNNSTGLTLDAVGNLYVADTDNHTIRKVTSAGVVTTVAGRAGVADFQAGPLPGLLSRPQHLAMTPEGDLVITLRNAVVQVTAPGVAAPQPSLAASSSTVPRGGTFTLTPTFSTGSGSIDQGLGAVSSGSPVTVTADWTGARTFTLTVTYTDGTKATAPVTVTPLEVSVLGITPANAPVTASTLTAYSATVTGGNLGTLTWSSGGVGSWSGSTWTAPASAGGPYTITATSVDDPTKSAATTVTVVAAPVATSLVASNATPAYGGTFTLTPTYSSGTGVIDNGVTCPATGVASGLLTANWAGARTYTLTVTNALGAVATATVTVTPAAPFVIDAFTANRSLVTFGGSATLSWTLSGPSPTALTLDGANVLGNLSAAVAPRNRQTFTLTGTSGNTDTKTLKVGAHGLDILAGSPTGPAGIADGTGTAAQFNTPIGLAVDTAGNTYATDLYNHTLRKISPAGLVSTLAGLAGHPGSADGTGAVARFNWPWGVAVDVAGNAYVADFNGSTVRRITPSGVVTTLAGLAASLGSSDGTGPAATFDRPLGVAVDLAGMVYVTDYWNNTIRKITPAGEVSTLAGLAGNPGSADGTGPAARFHGPWGVAVDTGGNLYVADALSNTLRKIIISSGEVSTLAGLAGNPGSADGTGPAAQFKTPCGVTVDAGGNVYVADQVNGTIRKVTPAGVVTTVAGRAGIAGSLMGPLPGGLIGPQGLALTPDGDLVVTSGYAVVQVTAP